MWDRWVEHPYQKIKSTRDTHGNLRKTRIPVPPFTTFAVPFAYMLSENQSDLDKRQPNRFPEDKVAPFPTAWVFGRERQKELLRHYFENRYLKKEQSLVFFYTNEGHPLGDSISRLLVGVETIMKIGALEEYDTLEEGQESYPLWDRLITHSIREEGEEGFLLPYHEYLTSTGDEAEDQRRAALLEEIIVTPDLAHNRTFSYASEHATPDVALSVLVRCLQAVKKIREHGIAEGPWEKREDWLNQQIAKAWVERGAFPGLGSALDALGMRLGTAMALELAASGRVPSDEDPWPIVEGILSGVIPPPQSVYEENIEVIRPVWRSLEPYRKELLSLLSCFALTPEQCLHWYHPEKRIRITGMLIEDIDILSNPYLIAEADLDNADHTAVSIGMIDREYFRRTS
ncbi:MULTISPECIES: hypothetical protein [unclassified Paenibacillus]|uniref:hypothetical protein n=1 Tax=unclassified Paenibacillus TaxID=185978 RepID=UPI0009CBDD62|nr:MULTISPECIES: hypothetical protein [unclassified Paenibacillus]SLK17377.1 hypothetical protein SAMN06272722_11180 [Paenibacillus sp. RU5A]SOC74737.1 hypothetical protein SAMN05880581_11180 [Paenibacillus sp. RU26A]SOC76868.1 hypothetical protein SAMN05880586_11180 [Paenibacillus sp. RU5M]